MSRYPFHENNKFVDIFSPEFKERCRKFREEQPERWKELMSSNTLEPWSDGTVKGKFFSDFVKEYFYLFDVDMINAGFIITPRNAGKGTYFESMMKVWHDRYPNDYLVWMRRYEPELQNWASDMNTLIGRPLGNGKLVKDKVYDEKNNLAMKLITMSTQHHLASSKSDNVPISVFDEILAHNDRYEKNEFQKLTNMIKTLERSNDHKFFALSNPNSKNNPYGTAMGYWDYDRYGKHIDYSYNFKTRVMLITLLDKHIDTQPRINESGSYTSTADSLASYSDQIQEYLHGGIFAFDTTKLVKPISHFENRELLYGIVVEDKYFEVYFVNDREYLYFNEVLPTSHNQEIMWNVIYHRDQIEHGVINTFFDVEMILNSYARCFKYEKAYVSSFDGKDVIINMLITYLGKDANLE